MRKRWLTAASAGLILVAAAPAPSNAQTTFLDTYTGGATATAVHLEVNLPAPVSLPVIGDVTAIVQDISVVDGEAVGTRTTVTSANAKAEVGTSTIAALNTLIARTVEASLAGERDDTDAVLAQDLGLVSAGIGAIEAHVTPEGMTDSEASLVSFRVGLAEESESDLVSLGAAKAAQHSGRDGDGVTAEGVASIADVSVLGGLVSIASVKTTSTAATSGAAGAAKATTTTEIVDLKVADVLDVSVTPDGVSGTVLGNELPDTANDALGTVLDTVNGVLTTAGVQILEGEVVEEAAPDGSTAKASSEGLSVIVNPLQAAKPLVSLQLTPASAEVSATRAADEPEAPVTPPNDELPETGGGNGGPAAAAALLLTAAVAIRRNLAKRAIPLT